MKLLFALKAAVLLLVSVTKGDEMLDAVNYQRSQNGLAPLCINSYVFEYYKVTFF
jgi:hypothetical protein